jgi:hypothetical protein
LGAFNYDKIVVLSLEARGGEVRGPKIDFALCCLDQHHVDTLDVFGWRIMDDWPRIGEAWRA